MVAIPEALTTAWEHHVAGRLDMAERIYLQILQAEPGHADALRLLGVLAGQVGRYVQAVEFLGAALCAHADEPILHCNLAGAYFGLGKFAEATACYQRALELQPHHAEAHWGLGRVRHALGQMTEAAACYRRALQEKPDLVAALANLGDVLADQGQLAEATGCYERALQIKPGQAQVHHNLGNAELALGQLEIAAASYQRALQAKPDYAEALANLGLVWKNLGRLDEATASLQRALSLKPHLAAAHNTLGLVWQKRGELDVATACFQRALDLEPNFAEAHNNLGHVLEAQGRLAEALASFRWAVHLKPHFVEADSNVLNTLHFCPGYDSAAIYEECRRWNQQHARPLARFIRPHGNDAAPERRLRIGYISPDFRDHCQAFFTVPLFSAHDHENFEVFCFADVPCADWVTSRLRSYADVWRDIAGRTDEQVGDLVRQDRIDILVDLTMHMARSRLLVFARKPAPVQVCWLAYPGTTGLDTIDYRLTDPYLDPPGMDNAHYSEETMRLPDSFWCYDPLTTEPAVGPLPALKNGYLTLGCLNNFCKVNVSILKVWAKVLRATGTSRLILLASEGKHREQTLKVLVEEGVTAGRVTFVSNRPRLQYLHLYHQIDVGLDTLPYNGHTTSLDSAWMGVPVVTMVGQTVVGRAGVCQLSNLGLRELIASTEKEFVNIVVGLASDLPRLSELRATLRERLQTSPLMDAPRFARNVEAAYRDMWRRWCGKPQ